MTRILPIAQIDEDRPAWREDALVKGGEVLGCILRDLAALECLNIIVRHHRPPSATTERDELVVALQHAPAGLGREAARGNTAVRHLVDNDIPALQQCWVEPKQRL